ncbi:MAG: ribonuclease HII [Firmicutes bacterium]|nr:ribonuclease HII [Bacillota bacterium]
MLYNNGYNTVAGVDEAGRGPLAGPVVAAAVILPFGPASFVIPDSKRVSEKRRDELYDEIYKVATAIGVGIVGPRRIDEVNIHCATLEAMGQAVLALKTGVDFCLVDGRFHIPSLSMAQRAVVLGDDRIDCVAAASIIAKVTRDRLLVELDHQYPHYGFAAHKGYPTPQHLAALQTYGPCPSHRFSFAPVRLAGQCSIDWGEGQVGSKDGTG